MTSPAPIWRRCAAAFYDGLLLLGLWMVALVVDTIVRDLVGLDRNWAALRAYLFLVGLGFFGWSWTHGGQTLGMRSWRLRVQRSDGAPLRWLDAALRYAVMLLCWGVALTPALLQVPQLASRPHAATIRAAALIALAMGLLWTLLDARRRAPQDRLSGTELVWLPPARTG
ncbi:RDD family protein [Sinimarinibacterium thermocellulolyticum]|uniref:RDD family protein n=1 Tax=Sinimarinibacterium thermocellulolyticum TaxID=3170016 RepID=A0ABV2A5H1_9GAMM